MLPALRVVMLPDFSVVMLPLLVLSVVMLPAKAFDEIAAVRMDTQTKNFTRLIVVSPGGLIVYWVGRVFGSTASEGLYLMPDQYQLRATSSISTDVPQML